MGTSEEEVAGAPQQAVPDTTRCGMKQSCRKILRQYLCIYLHPEDCARIQHSVLMRFYCIMYLE